MTRPHYPPLTDAQIEMRFGVTRTYLKGLRLQGIKLRDRGYYFLAAVDSALMDISRRYARRRLPAIVKRIVREGMIEMFERFYGDMAHEMDLFRQEVKAVSEHIQTFTTKAKRINDQ